MLGLAAGVSRLSRIGARLLIRDRMSAVGAARDSTICVSREHYDRRLFTFEDHDVILVINFDRRKVPQEILSD